jgi:hypothetical protein
MSCNATYAAIEKLRSAGAVLEELALAELDEINWTAINIIMLSEGPAIFADLVARFPDRTSDVLKKHVETGKTKTALTICTVGRKMSCAGFPVDKYRDAKRLLRLHTTRRKVNDPESRPAVTAVGSRAEESFLLCRPGGSTPGFAHFRSRFGRLAEFRLWGF